MGRKRGSRSLSREMEGVRSWSENDKGPREGHIWAAIDLGILQEEKHLLPHTRGHFVPGHGGVGGGPFGHDRGGGGGGGVFREKCPFSGTAYLQDAEKGQLALGGMKPRGSGE